MMFVFFPIDIIFLNKNKKIIEIKRNLKPWLFYTSKNKSKFFIEIPSNYSKDFKIKTGEILRW